MMEIKPHPHDKALRLLWSVFGCLMMAWGTAGIIVVSLMGWSCK